MALGVWGKAISEQLLYKKLKPHLPLLVSGYIVLFGTSDRASDWMYALPSPYLLRLELIFR